ncbi:basement membrane proteoglycan-like, partial [Anneissia japonica]|uniref:basement membrane proteoglycan-like n=1 Tax=Anneissia japonica TaxID=1529436 RepID=UPI001425731D
GNFQYTLGGGQVTREDLMMVLANLRMLQIRAQYHISMEYSSLMNVSLDIAADQGVEKVLTVEECNCPIGYVGLSCQVRGHVLIAVIPNLFVFAGPLGHVKSLQQTCSSKFTYGQCLVDPRLTLLTWQTPIFWGL